ncbi:MAG: DNA-processing protein DprA [Lachnospiraceae bacterium]|jgi:Predicted Rossmann fold nucleotide-binding protein involved in DNA uptake|nr:DNA-processing protein DprA [Lachnospiraceae bacterium]MCX4376457.1 DNA-processing protein DprA [Lachnospiraceae bacterium]
MKISDNAMTAILLCSFIGMNHDGDAKPLTLKEWNELLDRVVQNKQQPSTIMDQNFLKDIGYSPEYIERIKRLIYRGGTVAFALEELEKKGIGIVTQFDTDYPILIKRKLKRKAPPILFYSGDIGLAKKIGIGVVGSRNVDEEGIRFTQKLVEKAAREHLIIYSGGAKGIDTVSEKAALEYGSAAVSFVADSLLSKIRKKDILDAVINKKHLLLSDVKPDAGFSAARAMNRNKYIYASSYGTFVAASDYNTGGTWAGATEALKNRWTKVFVWQNERYEGNRKLIEKGAVPYCFSDESLLELITKKETFQQVDLTSVPSIMPKNKTEGNLDLYHVIAPYVMEHIGEGMTKEEAAEVFQVAKGQMHIWLNQLCLDSCLKCVKGRYVKQ